MVNKAAVVAVRTCWKPLIQFLTKQSHGGEDAAVVAVAVRAFKSGARWIFREKRGCRQVKI